MSFTLPIALVGLVVAALPLVLHLVRRQDPVEVAFPAVRYLEDATRNERRRLRLRDLLLLLVRTLLIVALVLAAAGPTVRRNALGPHASMAMVIVIDNSAPSAAVIDGEPVLASLSRTAQRILDHATASDRLWLIAADGIARSGSVAELRSVVSALRTVPLRLELGRAIDRAAGVLDGVHGQGTIVVLTPMARSASTASHTAIPLVLLHPARQPPANRAVRSLDAGLQPWGLSGGHVIITVASGDTLPVPVTLSAGGRTLRDVLVVPGTPSVQRIGALPAGWTTVTASLQPDEFRLDDSRSMDVRVTPPPAVSWNPTDRYISTAAQVLAADGRITAGTTVHLGELGPGPSVVVPPADPARVGALNRALAARGVTWQIGTMVNATARLDSSPLMPARETISRRYTLLPTAPGGEILVSVLGSPWAVRSGGVILVGSRFEPDWTSLPLSAAFVPLLDALLTTTSRGEMISASARVGEAFDLPAGVTAIAHEGAVVPTSGGSWTPTATGVFHLLQGTDTLGAVSVGLDPRVSELARLSDREARTLWPGASIASLDQGPRLAFSAGSRGDLRGFLLLLALACALAESLLAGRGRRG